MPTSKAEAEKLIKALLSAICNDLGPEVWPIYRDLLTLFKSPDGTKKAKLTPPTRSQGPKKLVPYLVYTPKHTPSGLQIIEPDPTPQTRLRQVLNERHIAMYLHNDLARVLRTQEAGSMRQDIPGSDVPVLKMPIGDVPIDVTQRYWDLSAKYFGGKMGLDRLEVLAEAAAEVTTARKVKLVEMVK